MEIFVGQIFENKKGHKWEVVSTSKGTRNIVIKSNEWHPYTTTVRKEVIEKQTIMYPYGRNRCGGYRGEGRWNASSSNQYHNIWISMLSRCNDGTYKDCVVSDEWYCLQHFCDWANEQHMEIGWELDKDLLGDGKLYSKDTCCFLPKEVNLFLASIKDKAIYEHVSVSGDVVSYRVWVRDGKSSGGHYIGSYSSYQEAEQVWRQRKQRRLDELCEKWCGYFPKHVYEALCSVVL